MGGELDGDVAVMANTGTYVYCVVAARRAPAVRGATGLAGMGRPRLIPLGRTSGRRRLGIWLVVADAPLDRYGEAAVNRRLSDLDWVARAAVAHERVVESFVKSPAVLPMKLLTIFASDARARAHVEAERRRIDGLIRRVANHQEWGVRVVLGRERPAPRGRPPAATPRTGKSFLMRKKAMRDRAAMLVVDARSAMIALFDRLAERAARSRRRTAGDLPVDGGPLLLDAAFLVPATGAVRFRRLVRREAKTLSRRGYRTTLTGPWPPYSFVQD